MKKINTEGDGGGGEQLEKSEKSKVERERKRERDSKRARTYSGLTVSPHPVTLLSKPNADT